MQPFDWLNEHWYVYIAISVAFILLMVMIVMAVLRVPEKSEPLIEKKLEQRSSEKRQTAPFSIKKPEQRISVEDASKKERIFQKLPLPPKEVIYTKLPPEKSSSIYGPLPSMRESNYDTVPAEVIYDKLPDVSLTAKDYAKAKEMEIKSRLQ